MKAIELYEKYCQEKGVPYEHIDSVRSYDDSTLFCPAGMQKFKSQFKDEEHIGTNANVQACIRLNDIDSLGDATHLLSFDMLGLFSFREMPVQEAVHFWMGFFSFIGLTIEHVTIHPDKMDEWTLFYDSYSVRIVPDPECKWSDGEIGGYCTEFYINDVEVGNIVNPLGSCIDAGFGAQRIESFLSSTVPLSKQAALEEAIHKIIASGYAPSNLRQGYVLRKLLRETYRSGHSIDHPFFQQEVQRQQRVIERYAKLKPKNPDKSKEWWFDTHGIDLNDVL